MTQSKILLLLLLIAKCNGTQESDNLLDKALDFFAECPTAFYNMNLSFSKVDANITYFSFCYQ